MLPCQSTYILLNLSLKQLEFARQTSSVCLEIRDIQRLWADTLRDIFCVIISGLICMSMSIILMYIRLIFLLRLIFDSYPGDTYTTAQTWTNGIKIQCHTMVFNQPRCLLGMFWFICSSPSSPHFRFHLFGFPHYSEVTLFSFLGMCQGWLTRSWDQAIPVFGKQEL